MNVLPLKENVGNDGEYSQRYAFLNHLQLNQVERSSISFESHAVSWNLAAIFKKCDSPREGNDSDQGPMAADACLLKFQMSVPGQRHEDVAHDQ